jgi:hypothetical protein
MTFKAILISTALLSTLSVSCKKDSKKAAEDEIVFSGDAIEKSVSGTYVAISSRIGQINIVGDAVPALHLQANAPLKLADVQVDPWDAAIWKTTEVFNCFGPCDVEGHSNTPAQFVAQALSPSRQASPMNAVQKSVNTLCLLSEIFKDELGFPAAGTRTINFDAELRDALSGVCSEIDIGENDFQATAVVSDLKGSAFDKKIEFGRAGEAVSTVLLRHDGVTINVASYEASEGKVSRTYFNYNVESGIFRFELAGFDAPGDISKSFNFYRGFIDDNTSDIRFTAVMGSNFKVADRWQNLSWLSINGQYGQNEIGATMSRQDAQQSFENKFVCFKAEAVTFINNTGCVEDPSNNRKSLWGYSSELFKVIAAKTPADWKLSENTGLAAFDATTMFSLAPIYE